MALGVFNMADVTFVWAGILITGYAEGAVLNWERTEDSSALLVGATGDATLAVTNNRSGQVTFRLLQTSKVNDSLSAKMKAFEAAPATGIGPLLVADRGGTTRLAAEKAWLLRPANGEMGAEGSEREWVLVTDHLQVDVGGN